MAIFSPQAKAILSVSGIATLIGTVSTVLSAKEFADNPQSVVLINSLILCGNIGANILAAEIQGVFGKVFKFFKKNEKNVNPTLQKLVRQAIFQVIKDNLSEAETENDEKILKSIIANETIDLKLEEILENHYKELAGSQKIYRLFSNKPETFANLTSAAPGDSWKEILKWLSEEDTRLGAKHFADLSDKSLETFGEKLHKNFPQALRNEILNESSDGSNSLNDLMLNFLGEISSLNGEVLQTLQNFTTNFEDKFNRLSTEQVQQRELLKEVTISLKQITTLLQFPPKSRNAAEIEQIKFQFYDLNRNISVGFDKFNEDFRRLFEIGQKQIEIQIETAQKIDKFYREWTETKQTNGKTHVLIAKSLPFSRPALNDYFTGRETVLEKIKEQIEKDGKASLFGLHGLGKTQTVLKFAKENGQNYAHIIFINAAKDLFLNSLAQFAEIFGLSWQNYGVQGREISDDEKKCYAVKDFLENDAVWSRETRRFLLIFDNVDEPEQVKPFVPSQNQGDLLFTSNSKYIKNRAPRVEIPSMDEKDAKLLLYRRGTGRMSLEYEEIPAEKHKVLEEIAENLAYLPVLLENAAVTIDETQDKFENYLEKLKNSPTIALEKEHTEVDYQFKNAKNGFSISFDLMTAPKLKDDEEKSVAEAVKEVLFACSVLAPANIPEELLMKYLEKLGNHLSEAAENDDFREKVRTRLTRFDLLDYDVEKASFDMHRFVQYVIWNYLIDKNPDNNKQIAILETTIAALDELFDYSKHETKENCELYTPHAVVLMEKTEKADLSTKEIARTNFKISRHLRQTVKYQDSITYVQKVIDFYQTLSEKEQTNLANCFNELALVYDLQGRYDEAIEKYEEALRIDEKTIGKEHPDYAIRLNNLAGAYHLQGRYDEAIEKYEEALRIGAKTIGKEHPNYAARLSNLAYVYQEQGKYNEAVEKIKEALWIDEKTIGKKHPDYAIRLNNLANTYSLQGKYDEAVEKFEEALRIDEETIGKKHPQYSNHLNNLGEVYRLQSRYDEALEKFEEALRIDEETIGKEHPQYSNHLNNLAAAYDSQGRYDEAIEKYNEAIQITEKTIGKEHPSYATRINNLAYVYQEQGKFDKALAMYEEAVRIFMKFLGENHPSTRTVKKNLENCQRSAVKE